ncbi:MAG TPA: alkaline phytoceramidase [Syntrophobacteraceae bacterium]|nr:alkaline phytoceramidase [Syntrophobacteraceae bacterium]HBZ56697.1 alkaline phytoceramidase [Syntrophobacteraceae bacterium]
MRFNRSPSQWFQSWKSRQRLSSRTGLFMLGLFSVIGALATMALAPVAQDPNYHCFADQRTFLGIRNCFNVVSNLGFVVAGALGCEILFRDQAQSRRILFAHPMERWPWWAFYLGVLLTGLGSAYYHVAPDNARLVWDRLPMTMIFTSFLAALVTERIDARSGCILLMPLLLLGAATVVAWHLSELQGRGDLRAYGFVHYLPVPLALFLLWGFPSIHGRDREAIGLLILYFVATIFEILDQPVYARTFGISGHTLKHLVAAMAIFWHAEMLSRRARPRAICNPILKDS